MSVPTLLQSTVQNVTYTGTAGASSAILTSEAPGMTNTVRLCATTDCWYLATVAGTTATSSNSSLLAAGNIEYIRVGNGTIISAVQVSTGGSLNITLMRDISTP